ncbi:uncharacterized protein LOC131524068 [Onychostoma macrolepis]|uniref:uncharacterized protein LOC131524068 n=1 Tax=Onychostoma macrolepis TaxID=369639 RepID=UPI00272B9FB4|nr:uncharacterized protein LOC131524068 [Onychostoma macrolepis]
MEELLKHLTEVSIRQQQIMEHVASRQGETGEDSPSSVRRRPAYPAPDPRVRATQLLPKMTVHDDPEHFLQMFEAVALREDWPPEEWARIIAPLLTGEAQRAYFTLPRRRTGSISPAYRSAPRRPNSRDWPDIGSSSGTSRPVKWLRGSSWTGFSGATRPLDKPLGCATPDHREVVEAIELADATLHREAGERVTPFPRRVVQERRTPEGTPRPVNRPAVPGPQDEPMPTEPPRSPNRAWLTGCTLHQEPPFSGPQTEVRINGRPFPALLDSGSTVSLIHPAVLPPRAESKALLSVTCVHGDTRQVPARRVNISAAQGTWPVEVGIIKDLPIPVLLGRDWPGFDRSLAASQPVSPAGNRRHRKPRRSLRRCPVLLASDSARDEDSM